MTNNDQDDSWPVIRHALQLRSFLYDPPKIVIRTRRDKTTECCIQKRNKQLAWVSHLWYSYRIFHCLGLASHAVNMFYFICFILVALAFTEAGSPWQTPCLSPVLSISTPMPAFNTSTTQCSAHRRLPPPANTQGQSTLCLLTFS